MTFYLTPYLKEDYFEGFVRIFKEKMCNKLFINKEDKNMLIGLSDNEEEEEQQTNKEIKNKITSRIERKLKKFQKITIKELEERNTEFDVIFMIRDFCYKLGYTPDQLIEIKKMNLNSAVVRKSHIIFKKENTMNPQREKNDPLLKHLDFLKFNNEPGGLCMISFVVMRLICLQNMKSNYRLVNKLMFGIYLNRKKMTQIFRVLDSFSPDSLILINLLNFLIEKECLDDEELFIKRGVEHLTVSFLLMHLDVVANELSVSQLINFLESFKVLLKDYFKKSYRYEYLLVDYRSEANQKEKTWIDNSKLKETLNENYDELVESVEIWLCVLKIAYNQSKPVLLILSF